MEPARNDDTGCEMAQPLFWQTYTIGSRQLAARFSASWTSPRLAVPSPNVHTHTRSVPAC